MQGQSGEDLARDSGLTNQIAINNSLHTNTYFTTILSVNLTSARPGGSLGNASEEIADNSLSRGYSNAKYVCVVLVCTMMPFFLQYMFMFRAIDNFFSLGVLFGT